MHRFIVILTKFIEAYSDTVHSTTGMAPSSHWFKILTIWKKIWIFLAYH